MKYDFSSVARATDKRIKDGVLPGAAMCVNLGGERVYEYRAGNASGDPLFRLCSMTKPVTVASALVLCDRGLLNVHDKISEYLPEFASPEVGKIADGKVVRTQKAKREITLEDLFTHSSGYGLVSETQIDKKLRSRAKYPSEMTEEYSRLYLDFSPGESQVYSALVALDLAVRIVEVVSGESYETFVKKNIFDPLGMRDTAYHLDGDRADRLVDLYALSDSRDKITRVADVAGHEGFPRGCVCGTTGLVGSLDDYSRFAEMLLGEGEYKGVRVLSRESVNAMRIPHFPFGFAGMDEFFDWGYAVRVRSAYKEGKQELTPQSYGWSGAYGTHFWVDPARSLTAVYMTNLDNAGGADAEASFEFECNVMRSLGGV